MELKALFLCFLLLNLLIINGNCYGEGSNPRSGIKRLFVFGDSYADTGNVIGMFRKTPYGITYPGKPAGRYSNGHILTDYLAKYLGLQGPVPYRWRKYQNTHLPSGMNFAFGGAGVFQTLYPRPNMSAQIDYFERLINQYSLYTKCDLEDSFVLVTLSGNDYAAYIERGGSIPNIFKDFVPKVVKELGVCLRRIARLGIKRIAVGSVPPFGCLPYFTRMTEFQQCSDYINSMNIHNVLLKKTVAKLNDEFIATEFGVLNLQDAFMTILNNEGDPRGKLRLPTPLKPCCLPTGQYNCGDLDGNGTKMFSVCDKPGSAFFWDEVHPTQAGWHAVFPHLIPTLKHLLNFG